MIEFPTVSKEIRSLVSRRQELTTFLGSVFAALGIFLQNTLGGNLPDTLASVAEHIFLFYAVLLMVPSLILALRMARLHGGMVINGILFARLMQDQDFTRRGDVARAGSLNLVGVSFLQFVLADFIAGFSVTVLALALTTELWIAFAAGLAIFLLWLAIYDRFHRNAVAIAHGLIAREPCAPFDRLAWEAHISGSLEDANHDLIANLSFVGLMIFSVFEVMSGLGQIKTARLPDLRIEHIRVYGPEAYTLLMLVTCLMGLLISLRLRVAVGRFSLDLDPSDRPFRPLVLTDSLLGYLLLAFFLAVSVHLALIQFAPALSTGAILMIDAGVLAIAALAEQVTLVVAGRRIQK